MCQGFIQFSVFLHHFVLVKLANNSIRVKDFFALTSGNPYWLRNDSVCVGHHG